MTLRFNYGAGSPDAVIERSRSWAIPCHHRPRSSRDGSLVLARCSKRSRPLRARVNSGLGGSRLEGAIGRDRRGRSKGDLRRTAERKYSFASRFFRQLKAARGE